MPRPAVLPPDDADPPGERSGDNHHGDCALLEALKLVINGCCYGADYSVEVRDWT
jgi:hypothetical protein